MQRDKKQTETPQTTPAQNDLPGLNPPDFKVAAENETQLAGGLAASQARLQMLVARKSDLEIKLQMIQQQRMQLANVSASLMQQASGLDPQDPKAAHIQAQIASIQTEDKTLELQSQQISAELQAVEAEIEQIKETLRENTEDSFGNIS